MVGDRQRTTLLTLIAISLACAPVSWVDDGVTPSWIVYPIVLLVAAWRVVRGQGALFLAIAAIVFWLVHLPWTWAALTGADEGPFDREAPSSPVQWLITLCVVPLVTAGIAGYIWLSRRQRGAPVAA